MILNEDYKFRDDLVKKETDTVPIELLLEQFKGIIFKFDKVQIREEEKQARMTFDYTLLEKLDFVETKLRKDATFNRILGLVLNAMLLEFAEHEHRENNSEEFVEDGNLHP